jgi:glyoxylase-like metal-dependent hydrolase (beta-lactamase superfamily II)
MMSVDVLGRETAVTPNDRYLVQLRIGVRSLGFAPSLGVRLNFQVDCLPMGIGYVPGPEVFWMNDWGEWYPLAFQVVLVRRPGVIALVNTGPAEDLDPMNDGWASFLGERARLKREPGQFVVDQLALHGVAPEDVTHVILTPLQLYTVSNVMRFPNASIYISKRGWVHFNTSKAHPHDDRDTSIPPGLLRELVTTAWPRVVLLEDEDEVLPGLRTWWAGSHHRATIAVEVDTSEGTVVISDAFFYLENLERNRPIGICENIYEALAAHERAAKSAIALPLYDPKNFSRFPNGIGRSTK